MNLTTNAAAEQPDLFVNWRRLINWVSDHYAEIATALGIGILIVLALIGLRGLIRRLLGGSRASGWRKVAEGIVARTYLFIIVMAAAEIVTMHAVIPRRLDQAIDTLFVVAAALQVAIWFRALIIGAIERKVGSNTESARALGTAMELIRGLVTVGAFLIAIIVILDNVGVDVTGLIAGLGIGGIAIGLAAQGIFKDLFAALAIIFDRPFRKGDTINFGGANGFTGTVEHIGLKSTRLRAVDGEMVAVGNDKLLLDRVHNYTLQERRRGVLSISVMPHTHPGLIDTLPREMETIVAAQPQATFDRGEAIRFGPNSIDYELVFFMETADFAAFAKARHEIIVAVIRRLSELGIAFAPPPAAPAGPAAADLTKS